MPPALRLLRPANLVLSLAAVAVGGALARGAAAFGAPHLGPLMLAMVVGALVGSASNADNDVLDVEIDRVNRPDRPVTSGAVTPAGARMMWLSLTALALLLAVAVSVDVAALAAASAVLLGAYNRWLKGLPLVGNVAVAAVIAAAPLLGALAVEAVPPAVVAAVTLTFGIALAREMTKDVEDTVGDAAAGARTLPVVWGEGRAAWAAVVVIGATVAGLPLAVALGVERSFLAYVVGAALCLLAAAWVLAVGTVARGSVLRRSATRARQWLKAGMVAGVIALLATALG